MAPKSSVAYNTYYNANPNYCATATAAAAYAAKSHQQHIQPGSYPNLQYSYHQPAQGVLGPQGYPAFGYPPPPFSSSYTEPAPNQMQMFSNFAKYDGRKRAQKPGIGRWTPSFNNRHKDGFKDYPRRGGGGEFSSRGNNIRDRKRGATKHENMQPHEETCGPNISSPYNILLDARFNFYNLPAKARVLLVSNIPQNIAKPKYLYNLFSVYGDVHRVKILRKKLDSGLVEFSTATLAMIARNHMDQVELSDQKLVVSFARFDRIRLPSECGQSDDGLTEDFTTPAYEKFHRFARKDLVKSSLKRIMKPSKFLYVSNIPFGSKGSAVKQLIESEGLDLKEFVTLKLLRKRPSDCRIKCYVEMGDVSQAILALIHVSRKMREKNDKGEEVGTGLRIVFSHTSMEEEKKLISEAAYAKVVPDDE